MSATMPLAAGDASIAPGAAAFHAALGRAAIVSLYDELALEPKPGLVSFADAGSHHDMDAGTFLRSLFALRHYFVRIAAQGAASTAFAPLELLGIAAEARMLRATGGVNTHRGAIFGLGLLCAAAGYRGALGIDKSLGDLCRGAGTKTSFQVPYPCAAMAPSPRGATAPAAPGRKPPMAFPRCMTSPFPRCMRRGGSFLMMRKRCAFRHA